MQAKAREAQLTIHPVSHPFSLKVGYSAMNAPADPVLSSCSSMSKPGTFGPLENFWMFALASDSKKVELSIFQSWTSWFQMTAT